VNYASWTQPLCPCWWRIAHNSTRLHFGTFSVWPHIWLVYSHGNCFHLKKNTIF
jgi:hypothetical protein